MKLRSSLRYLFLTIIFVVPAVFSLLYFPFFTFHDETQIVNMYEFFKTIDLGQFPPRWGLDFHFNYGSPFLQFYYQIPYYLGYLLHLLGLNIVSIFKLILIFGLFSGAIGMYFLGLELSTPLWAFVAAIIYTYTPYRAVTSFVRGSLGESLSLAFFPWIFLLSLRLYKKPSLVKAILAGLSWGILVLTHQLATIFFLPLVFLIGVLFALFNRKLVAYLIVSLLTSFGISAYYFLPTIFEQKFIKPGSPFNFYDHFPFLKQLLWSTWGYRASIWGINDGLSFQLGIIPILVLLLSLFLGFRYLRTKVKTTTKLTYLVLILAFSGTIFLMNIRSSFIWEMFNFAQLVQFPWRLLMLTTFLVPTIFLFVSQQVPQKLTLPFALIFLALSPLLTIRYYQPGEIYDRDDDYYLHRYLPNIAVEDKESISSAYLEHTEDYVSLPIDAMRPNSLPSSKLTAENETTKIFTLSDYPFNSTYQVETESSDTITFHTFYFPGWTVKQSDHVITPKLNENGAIMVPVDTGKHTFNFTFQETPLRRISNYVSLVTLAVIAFVFARMTTLRKNLS